MNYTSTGCMVYWKERVCVCVCVWRNDTFLRGRGLGFGWSLKMNQRLVGSGLPVYVVRMRGAAPDARGTWMMVDVVSACVASDRGTGAAR